MFNIFKKKPRKMTEEEEAEEIMLRLTFPGPFHNIKEIKPTFGIDFEDEIRQVMRAELDARQRNE
jgi:hypothetical protein